MWPLRALTLYAGLHQNFTQGLQFPKPVDSLDHELELDCAKDSGKTT